MMLHQKLNQSTINGFNELDKTGLEKVIQENGMAMNYEDLKSNSRLF